MHFVGQLHFILGGQLPLLKSHHHQLFKEEVRYEHLLDNRCRSLDGGCEFSKRRQRCFSPRKQEEENQDYLIGTKLHRILQRLLRLHTTDSGSTTRSASGIGAFPRNFVQSGTGAPSQGHTHEDLGTSEFFRIHDPSEIRSKGSQALPTHPGLLVETPESRRAKLERF